MLNNKKSMTYDTSNTKKAEEVEKRPRGRSWEGENCLSVSLGLFGVFGLIWRRFCAKKRPRRGWEGENCICWLLNVCVNYNHSPVLGKTEQSDSAAWSWPYLRRRDRRGWLSASGWIPRSPGWGRRVPRWNPLPPPGSCSPSAGRIALASLLPYSRTLNKYKKT